MSIQYAEQQKWRQQWETAIKDLQVIWGNLTDKLRHLEDILKHRLSLEGRVVEHMGGFTFELNEVGEISIFLKRLLRDGCNIEIDDATFSRALSPASKKITAPRKKETCKIQVPDSSTVRYYDCPDYTLLTELRVLVNVAIEIIEEYPQKHDISLMTKPQIDELTELYEIAETEAQQMDDRYDILPYHAARYIEALALGSIRRISDPYHRLIKKTHELSTKQVSKFFKGRSKTSPFEPKDSEQAVRWGYTGKRCPNCESLRYEEKLEGIADKPIVWYRCYHCSHVEYPKLPAKVELHE